MPAAAVAAVGVGVSAWGVSQSSKAYKKSAQGSEAAASEAIALQREQYANAFKILSKYGAQGDWASDQIAALMGAPKVGAPRASDAAPGSVAQTPDWGAYYDRYLADPGIDQSTNWEKNAKLRAMYGNDRDAFAEDNYRMFGQPEGRELPTIGGVQPGAAGADEGDDFKTPDQRREEAFANYKATPWASIARTNAKNAVDDFTSMAGAQGSALSGRTVRGMAEVSNEMEQAGFGDYFSALQAVSDRGYQADTGIASGGQAFADRAGAIKQDAADAAGRARVGSTEAWTSAMSDAAGWGGWLYGQYGNDNKPRTVTPGASSPGASTPGRRNTSSAFKTGRTGARTMGPLQ